MSAVNAPSIERSRGFRKFKVVDKRRESSVITSFHLEPLEQHDWTGFRPGQFLTFRIPAKDGDASILRHYSVSGSPAQSRQYRITVKREARLNGSTPDGVSSCFLHDRIEIGDVLSAQGPTGLFVLDQTSERPVVLLSGGVGLTPLVSMLHALATTDRRVLFLHACENGDVHALRGEVEAIAASRPGIAARFCYRTPTEADRREAHFLEGVISRDVLQDLLHLDDYDFYLCGPPAFMQAVYALVRGLGVPATRIAYEFFGPATVLEKAVGANFPVETVLAMPTATEPARSPLVTAEPAGARDAAMVEFRASGIVATWQDGEESLLSFAEHQGLEADFSCRVGVCGTCITRLIAGEVAYFETPLDVPPPGEVLLCCSRPVGPVVLDL